MADAIPAHENAGSARPTYAVEAEVKRWLARELHDRVAQTLTTMLVELEVFKIGQAGRQSVISQVDLLEDSTRAVLHNIRHLLRDLREEPRHDLKFTEAVGDALVSFQERTAIETALRMSPEWPTRLSATASYNLIRILEEALANVMAHSRATRVEVELSVKAGGASLSVTDNGTGLLFLASARRPGYGVIGINERAAILGADASITTPAGGGTTVSVTFPLENLQ